MPNQQCIQQTLAPAFQFGSLLLGTGSLDERIGACITLTMEFLDAKTEWTLLESLSAPLGLTVERRQSLAPAIDGISHVGFLLPGGTDEDALSRIAQTAGLELAGSIPSRVFCMELGGLAGRESVDTRIFRMHGTNAEGRRVGIELFVPEAEPLLVAPWIAAGIGTHVGLRVVSRDAVGRIHRTLASCEGFIPSFMQGQPKENATEGSTVLYYDLPLPQGGRKLRLEFCHSPGNT